MRRLPRWLRTVIASVLAVTVVGWELHHPLGLFLGGAWTSYVVVRMRLIKRHQKRDPNWMPPRPTRVDAPLIADRLEAVLLLGGLGSLAAGLGLGWMPGVGGLFFAALFLVVGPLAVVWYCLRVNRRVRRQGLGKASGEQFLGPTAIRAAVRSLRPSR